MNSYSETDSENNVSLNNIICVNNVACLDSVVLLLQYRFSVNLYPNSPEQIEKVLGGG